jgi:hypothetical protein
MLASGCKICMNTCIRLRKDFQLNDTKMRGREFDTSFLRDSIIGNQLGDLIF